MIEPRSWPERRFSQAISEGDGISVIPVLDGDVVALAKAAEDAGAEALVVEAVDDVARLRALTDLPLVVRRVGDLATLESARRLGADACVLAYEELRGDERTLASLVTAAQSLGLDWLADIQDEDELEEALEHLDPDIVLISGRDGEAGAVELEHTLALLADVPAGKLVVSCARVSARAEVLDLERAGVDAVVLDVRGLAGESLGALVAILTGK